MENFFAPAHAAAALRRRGPDGIWARHVQWAQHVARRSSMGFLGPNDEERAQAEDRANSS